MTVETVGQGGRLQDLWAGLFVRCPTGLPITEQRSCNPVSGYRKEEAISWGPDGTDILLLEGFAIETEN